jgi:hypothetical protein
MHGGKIAVRTSHAAAPGTAFQNAKTEAFSGGTCDGELGKPKALVPFMPMRGIKGAYLTVGYYSHFCNERCRFGKTDSFQ